MSVLPENPLDLVVLAGNAKNRDELFFTIVNRSLAVCSYDRASVWRRGRRPTPLAVSGPAPVDGRSPFVAAWSAAFGDLKDKNAPGRLSEDRFGDKGRWKELAAATNGLAALWYPLPAHGAGVLFERWGGQTFSPEEEKALLRLAVAYSMIGGKPGRRSAGGWGRAILWPLVLAAVVAALIVVRLPLRVVAECEVAPRNSRLIAAPMDGVIDQVTVTPGQRVKAGEVLASYDSRLMEEELKISRQQVAVVEAELAGARARGFSETRYRGETAVLEARLEQETARLEALEARFSRRDVVAPVDGMVQLDNARAWRGRPVSTGQAVMWLVDPDDTRVNLWLPQDDRIDIDASRPIYIHLHALGGEGREAGLTYVSSFAQPAPGGVYGFPAEAEWRGGGKSPPLGLRGSASLYGEEVSLGYWLFRRPMAWVRRWLGV